MVSSAGQLNSGVSEIVGTTLCHNVKTLITDPNFREVLVVNSGAVQGNGQLFLVQLMRERAKNPTRYVRSTHCPIVLELQQD